MSRRPGRRAMTLTMDCDAVDVLKVLSPSGRGYGHLLSELLRQEAVRREECKKILQELFREEPPALVEQSA